MGRFRQIDKQIDRQIDRQKDRQLDKKIVQIFLLYNYKNISHKKSNVHSDFIFKNFILNTLYNPEIFVYTLFSLIIKEENVLFIVELIGIGWCLGNTFSTENIQIYIYRSNTENIMLNVAIQRI